MTASSRPSDAEIAAKWAEEGLTVQRLAASADVQKGEQRKAELIRGIAEQGLSRLLKRKRAAGQEALISLARDFLDYGAAAILSTGSPRGGDFLATSLRGRWAEEVALSIQLRDYVILRFGPSESSMPGAEDHAATVRNFKAIQYIEGKRPDLMAIPTEVWRSLNTEQQARAKQWPHRLLSEEEAALIRQHGCGIEVKNSTWHYQTRRHNPDAGPLSVTVKDEELEPLDRWLAERGNQLVFVQVLFDEIYCLNYRRMKGAIARGHLYAAGDYKNVKERNAGGKLVHFFFLTDQRHKCGDVEFPADSTGHVEVLTSGSVAPYINYAPARLSNTIAKPLVDELRFNG
jgi:hypothetical protein